MKNLAITYAAIAVIGFLIYESMKAKTVTSPAVATKGLTPVTPTGVIQSTPSNFVMASSANGLVYNALTGIYTNNNNNSGASSTTQPLTSAISTDYGFTATPPVAYDSYGNLIQYDYNGNVVSQGPTAAASQDPTPVSSTPDPTDALTMLSYGLGG
jgi:hypothetical protein